MCEDCGAVKAFFAPQAAKLHGVDTMGCSTTLYQDGDGWVPKAPACRRKSGRSGRTSAVIWARQLENGITLTVPKMLKPLKGYREENEFTVCWVKPNGGKGAVCTVGEDGVAKRWFVSGDDRVMIEEAIKDLPNTLLVELVSRD